MSEYITKERALQIAKTAVNLASPDAEIEQIANNFLQIHLKAEPAANVVQMAYGKWIGIESDGYDPDGNIVWEVFECSNCGCEHHADGEPTWDYCPDCGAKMDGGEND